MKSLKKLLVIILSLAALIVSALAFSGCVKNADPTGDADITANWRFYSVTGDGETTYRFPTDRDEDLPFFVSNGTDFEISTVPGTVRRGTVAVNEDGTYTLTMAENGNEFQAVIEGNMLTIYFPDDRELAFEAVN